MRRKESSDMKPVGCSTLLPVFCITLILLSASQSIYADPVARSLGPVSPALHPIATKTNFEGEASALRSFGAPGNPDTLFKRATNTPSVPSNGTYTVTNLLRTASGISASPAPFAIETAMADFATRSSDVFFGGVDAVPVPESSTLFLLGLGLIALSQIPLRRLAKKSPPADLKPIAHDMSKQEQAKKGSSLAA